MIKFVILIFIVQNVYCETSLEKFHKIGTPFLETYWESFSVLPYDTNNCADNNLQPNYIDETDYAARINQIPKDSVKVVNIAFATVNLLK